MATSHGHIGGEFTCNLNHHWLRVEWPVLVARLDGKELSTDFPFLLVGLFDFELDDTLLFRDASESITRLEGISGALGEEVFDGEVEGDLRSILDLRLALHLLQCVLVASVNRKLQNVVLDGQSAVDAIQSHLGVCILDKLGIDPIGCDVTLVVFHLFGDLHLERLNAHV